MVPDLNLKEALTDAGCSRDFIDRFLQEPAKQEDLLEKHRAGLLAQIHEDEKKIRTVDYISWSLKKSQ